MNKKRIIRILAGAAISCLLLAVSVSVKTRADEASTVSIGATNYETLTMEINRNGNSIIYSSLDNKKTWNEVDGTAAGDTLLMDIQFASSTSNVDVWLKGDKDTKVIKVTIPKQPSSFKVKYDRGTGRFELSGYDDHTTFRWHKSSDSNYKTVDINPNSSSYAAFCKEVEKLSIKGAKILLGLEGKNGTGIDDMGERPAKEVLVTIPKKAAAPNIKLNVSKLTFNTRDTMEYQVIGSGSGWKSCQKNMSLNDVAPEVYTENGARTVSIKFRTAATSSKPASLECFYTVKGQRTGPSIGSSGDVTVTQETVKDKKGNEKTTTTATFVTASKDRPFEYKIVKLGESIDLTKGWKLIKQAGKAVKFTEKKLPKGSMILVRYKGINANANKGIEAEIPSAYTTYTVG